MFLQTYFPASSKLASSTIRLFPSVAYSLSKPTSGIGGLLRDPMATARQRVGSVMHSSQIIPSLKLLNSIEQLKYSGGGVA